MSRSSEVLELIGRRHPEWREHQLRWRWLLDSLEGGDRYRNAVYGYDRRGLPVRNLVRQKRGDHAAPGRVRVVGRRDADGHDGRRLRAEADPHPGPHVRGRGRDDPPGEGL